VKAEGGHRWNSYRRRHVSGKTGRVSNAKVTSSPFKGTPVGACIESAVKRARVPRFKQSSFKVTFPYRL
jgi:hypothetical protein